MLRLKLRGDTYYVVGQINGRRIRKTTKTSDKSIANEIRVQMEHEMLTGRRSTTTQKTFNQAVESYLKRREHTSNTTSRYLVGFMDEWGHMPVGDINQMFLEDWMDDRLSEVAGPTVRREVNVFMPVLRHANKRGWIDEVPIIERPADGEPRLRVLDEAEYQALMGACTPITADAAGLTKFLLHTGARIGEAIKLTWEDVSLGAEPYCILRTRKRKGGREAQRTVPLNDVLLDIIDLRWGKVVPTSGQVFTRWTDQRAAGKCVISYANDLGIGDFRPHDLRRTFATRLLERGANPRTVADLLGHTSLTMVMRYMVPPDHVKKDAVMALAEPKGVNRGDTPNLRIVM